MSVHPPLPALALLLAALLLGGCASQVPLLIRQGPLDSPAPAVVRERFGDYAGRAMRWGGVLITTENRVDVTRLTILARPLTSDGEPGTGDSDLGRFIAIVPGFLDPQVYTAGRLVTVTGTLAGSELGLVGNHPYVYPLAEAQAWYLWPEPEPPYGYPYPWWYDPWHGPWWYGSWYDPWYYPTYHPRWYPHRHPPHQRRPEHPDTVPAPEARPIRPEPGHPRRVPRAPRERPEAGTTPPPGHIAAPPHGERPGKRQRTEPRERPQADAAPPRERNREHQRERMERGMERSPPEPVQQDGPDTERGIRGFFRRWRED